MVRIGLKFKEYKIKKIIRSDIYIKKGDSNLNNISSFVKFSYKCLTYPRGNPNLFMIFPTYPLFIFIHQNLRQLPFWPQFLPPPEYDTSTSLGGNDKDEDCFNLDH